MRRSSVRASALSTAHASQSSGTRRGCAFIAATTAAVAGSVSVAIAGFMIVLVYSLLLGGFIVSKSDLGGIGPIVQTSYFWQGYELLMVNEFEGDAAGDERLERMGMSREHLPANFAVLAGMIVG